MSPLYIILALQIFILDLRTVSSLPVTSKPIENTPEHLAWEAWIMVPPSKDKTRKITPKSIFILPNKTNGGSGGSPYSSAIQCPPGHRVDNFRCIPTISIDRSQILITQLQNLIHSSNGGNSPNSAQNEGTNYGYDYDYDYGDAYDPDNPQSFTNTGGNLPSDYNGEPLKINLSIGKLPPPGDSKEISSFGLSDSETEEKDTDPFNMPPFRFEEPSSTTTSSPTTTPTTTTTTTTVASSTEESPDSSPEISSTPRTSTEIIVDADISFSTSSPAGHPADDVPSSATAAAPESVHEEYNSTPEPEMMTTTTEQLDEQTTESKTESTTTISDVSEIELVTEIEQTTSNLKDDLLNESLVFENDKLDVGNATETTEESTENAEDDIPTTISIARDDFEESSSEGTTLNPDEASTNQPTVPSPTSPSSTHSELEVLHDKLLHIDNNSSTTKKIRESIEEQEDTGTLMDSIESNNRFVYHHLSVSSTTGPERVNLQDSTPTTTEDYREQLKIINRIVEENQKRSQTAGSQIKFPVDAVISGDTGNFRSGYVRFPDSPSQDPFLPPTAVIPLDRHRYPTDRKSLVPSVVTPTQATANHRNTKPFWWLPTGWEIDRNGQKPLLVRFWSKSPSEGQDQDHDQPLRPDSPVPTVTQPRSASPTTSGYRENSRSPTENLYREISAQDVYKVLGAKNWKHNER